MLLLVLFVGGVRATLYGCRNCRAEIGQPALQRRLINRWSLEVVLGTGVEIAKNRACTFFHVVIGLTVAWQQHPNVFGTIWTSLKNCVSGEVIAFETNKIVSVTNKIGF